MKIEIDSMVHGRSNIINIDQGPLKQSFKIDDISILRHDNQEYILKHDPDLLDEYSMWLESKAKAGDEAVLDTLDEIATKAMSDVGVILITAKHPQRSHGNVIEMALRLAMQGKWP